MNSLEIKQVTYQQALTEIRSIREKVFAEEQGVDPRLEFDGEDENSFHPNLQGDSMLLAWTRS
jgi:predicted GNAT family N-acyltransferase